MVSFFNRDLCNYDPEVYACIENEKSRQKSQLQLIASENLVSKAVLQVQGSVLTNKYAEGYPNKRYYCGCQWVDRLEMLAIDRLCQLFNCKFANVQPHSGSQANQEVMMALLKPGDTILGMSLDCGGHLTHGSLVNFSGKWFNSVQYGVHAKTHLIDMEEVEYLAQTHKPSLIIAGASSYPRAINFKKFREIADNVGAYMMSDIAHYSGLIAANQYPSSIEYSHVTTSTTHKTLRGPRGGIIMTNDESVFKKIQSSVFPGLQGGPLMHVIAAKAVAFAEALHDEFTSYIIQVIKNAQSLAEILLGCGFDVLTSGTDSHIVLLDLRSQHITGKDAVLTLERSGINCNKNAVPFDTEKPWITSGLRFGSAAETSRGLECEDFRKIGHMISKVLKSFVEFSGNNSETEEKVKEEVKNMCFSFTY